MIKIFGGIFKIFLGWSIFFVTSFLRKGFYNSRSLLRNEYRDYLVENSVIVLGFLISSLGILFVGAGLREIISYKKKGENKNENE